MKYKIFVILFLLCLLFYFYISSLNPDNVKFYYGGGKSFETSVADFVVFSFVFGVIFSIILSLFFDVKKAFAGWREERKGKRKEEFRELFEKAKSYDLKGDREKAVEYLNRVIRRAPDMEETYLFLADLYGSMNEYGKAVDVLNLATMNMGKKETILLSTVQMRLAQRDTSKIEGELKEILKINEMNFDALRLLRDHYLSKKNWGDAFEMQKRLRKYVKTDAESRRYLGIWYEKVNDLFGNDMQGNAESIMSQLKEIIGEDKRFVPAYILLAELYKRTGKLNEAARVYDRGYSKTGHVIFLLRMEDLYIDRGDPEVILKIYTRILDVSPKDYLITFLYARLCLRLEMIDEAIDMLNALLAEGTEFSGLHRAMAEAYVHRGEMEMAVQEFRSAFPMGQVYIPFKCDTCQSQKESWRGFCDVCYDWNTVNVKKEDFLQADSRELRKLYEEEDWARGS
jgi:tetratricopeptide (TPR) repeat protein